MPCGCQKKKESFQVVTQDGAGRSVFSSPSKDTAAAISRKYPGSVVKDAAGAIVHRNPPPEPVKKAVTGGPHEVE